MYYRLTRVNFDPSKYDAMLANMNSTNDQFRGISGCVSVLAIRTAEDQASAIAQYESKEAAEAAQEQVRAILGGMAENDDNATVVHDADSVAATTGEFGKGQAMAFYTKRGDKISQCRIVRTAV